MKKYCVLFIIAILLLLIACSQVCEICGLNHNADDRAGLAGSPSRHAYFEIFAPASVSNESLRVYVASCWSGSITPEYRLGFISQYDITDLYTAISAAESNVPFEIIYNGETIILSTNIIGLEEITISLDKQQREVGFTYILTRKDHST